MKRIVDWRLIAKVIVAVAILAWLILRADVGKIGQLMETLTAGTVLALVALLLLSICVAAVKWRVLLPERTLRVLFQMNLISQFYSVIVPSALGAEAIKAYQLGRGSQDAERVAASVLLDKVTSLVAILVLGLCGAALTTLSVGVATRAVIIGANGVCIGLLFALRSDTFQSTARAGIVWARRRMPSADRFLNRVEVFLESWHDYLAQPMKLAFSVLVGIVHQTLAISILALLAARLGVSLPFYEWCWIAALMAIATLAPITFAGLGVREGVLVGLLSTFGIAIEPALAISFSLFALSMLMGAMGLLVQLTWKGAHERTIDS